MGIVAVAAMIAVTLSPARLVGFLADDYFIGVKVLEHQTRFPGLPDRIARTFTERWADGFEAFRPIPLLTFQLDHFAFGADGRRHHLQSLALWVGMALCAAMLARSVASSRRAAMAVTFVLTATAPAPAEALGWLAARSDLLLACFALLFLRARIARPRHSCAGLIWLTLAFCSKETALALVPTGLVLDLVALPTGPRLQRSKQWVRIGLPFVVAAAWAYVRSLIFGSAAGAYNHESYLPALFSPHTLENFVRSLGHLAVPTNDVLLAARGIPRWPIVCGLLVPPVLVLVMWLLHGRRRGDLRVLTTSAVGVLTPILLQSPTFAVGAAMEQGRALAFPSAIVAAMVAATTARLWSVGRSRGLLVMLIAIYVATSAACLWLSLDNYAAAGKTAESLLSDLNEIPGPARVLVLGLGDPNTSDDGPGSPMRQEVTVQNGAYILSGALPLAVRRPFRNDAGLDLVRLPRADLVRLLAAESNATPQPAIVALSVDGARPRFVVLAHGPSIGRAPIVEPATGVRLSDSGPFTLSAAQGDGSPVTDAVLFHASVASGHTATGRAERLATSTMPGTATFTCGSLSLSTPITVGALRANGAECFVWWCEGLAAGKRTWRSAWQVVDVSAGAK